LRSFAHIIGVSVSDTTADTRMAAESVSANSRKRRPTMSPMNRSGISTAISDTVKERIVKPIWRRSDEGRLERLLALFDVAADVLDHDDRRRRRRSPSRS
jgi:hypothetical protein